VHGDVSIKDALVCAVKDVTVHHVMSLARSSYSVDIPVLDFVGKNAQISVEFVIEMRYVKYSLVMKMRRMPALSNLKSASICSKLKAVIHGCIKLMMLMKASQLKFSSRPALSVKLRFAKVFDTEILSNKPLRIMRKSRKYST
jgi:hypothetical protein